MINSAKKWLTSAALGASTLLGVGASALPTTSAIVAAASATAAVVMLPNTAEAKKGAKVFKIIAESGFKDQNGNVVDAAYIKQHFKGTVLHASGFAACDICAKDLTPTHVELMKALIKEDKNAKFLLLNTAYPITKNDIKRYVDMLNDKGIQKDRIVILQAAGREFFDWKEQMEAARELQIKMGNLPALGDSGEHSLNFDIVIEGDSIFSASAATGSLEDLKKSVLKALPKALPKK